MSLQEQMRANKRTVDKAVRDIDRERAALEREKKRLERDIKNLAKRNEMEAVRIQARDLVRTRQHISKFLVMKSNLQSLSLKMQTMKSSHEMGMAMGKMTKAMKTMNSKMNAQSINKIVLDFERENEKAEISREAMNDAMDTAFETADGEEDEDAIVHQVLDEIGVDLTGELQTAPTEKVKVNPVAASEPVPEAAEPIADDASDAAVNDLEARLNNLRRGN